MNRKRSLERGLVCIAVLATLAGCDAVSVSGGAGDNPPGPNPPSNPHGEVTSTALQGSWKTDCRESVQNSAPYRAANSGWIQRTLSFTGAGFQLVVNGYHQAGCTDDQLGVVFKLSGTFTVGGSSQAPDQGGQPMGNDLNLQIADLSLMPVTADAAAFMNTSGGYCQKSDWRAQDEQPLLGQGCENALLDSGIVSYDVASISGGKLLLGSYYQDYNDGWSADKRPTNWSWNEEFTAQSTPTPSPTPTPTPTPSAQPLTYADLAANWADTAANNQAPNNSIELAAPSGSFAAGFDRRINQNQSNYENDQGSFTIAGTVNGATLLKFQPIGSDGPPNAVFQWQYPETISCLAAVTGTAPARSLQLACGVPDGAAPADLSAAVTLFERQQ